MYIFLSILRKSFKILQHRMYIIQSCIVKLYVHAHVFVSSIFFLYTFTCIDRIKCQIKQTEDN